MLSLKYSISLYPYAMRLSLLILLLIPSSSFWGTPKEWRRISGSWSLRAGLEILPLPHSLHLRVEGQDDLFLKALSIACLLIFYSLAPSKALPTPAPSCWGTPFPRGEEASQKPPQHRMALNEAPFYRVPLSSYLPVFYIYQPSKKAPASAVRLFIVSDCNLFTNDPKSAQLFVFY